MTNRLLIAILGAALLGGWTSVHQQALEAHADAPTFAADSVVWPTPEQLAVREARGVGGPTVMGYLPYWVEPTSIPWESLDILAWFSTNTNADGSLGNDHGWGDEAALEVIGAAHAAGARVVLSTTRFGGDDVAELLNNPTASQNAIANLVDAMVAGGGDGIDIDYEGLNASDRDLMVEFIVDLRAAMDDAQPGSLLTMATPAVDWGGAWDYDALATYADVLFIMGYAFAGGWSNPKPNAPLDGSDRWGSRSLRWSVQDYLEWGGAHNADKIVLGLPLYGHDWESEGPEVPGTSLAGGDDWARFFDTCQDQFATHGFDWDDAAATPHTSWQDGGTWHQLWCEDVDSIVLKAAMAWEEGIGGFGFWALNYDDGDAELWGEISELVQEWEGVDGDDDDATDDDDSAGDDDDLAGDDDDLTPPMHAEAIRSQFGDGDGCACATASGSGSFGLTLLVLLAVRRRR
ncbi:MAG: hypothetical protein GY898_03985 [Proteobacteria bacterium]|nr:hypothetical protein [Pseudomonadota bacterium]